MRFIVVAISFLAVMMAQETGVAKPNSAMSDPVFGIGYDPTRVHFEIAPPVISRLCSEAHGREYWVYAHWKGPSAEFFIISNRESVVSGGAVVISGGKCTQGVPPWLLTGNPEYAPTELRDGRLQPLELDKGIAFTPAVLHGLAQDLLRRYTAAFGSKKAFLDAVAKDGLPPDENLPVLKTEFEKFARSQ